MDTAVTPPCCILFVKLPEPGRVKTRLARVLGAADAARLYRQFVVDQLRELELAQAQQPLALRVLYDAGDCDAPLALERCVAWLGKGHCYEPQIRGDLGARMDAAMCAAFHDGFERVLLLGSDVPDFPAALLCRAHEELARHDAVISPVADGGYCLVGFRRDAYLPEIFMDMPWSTPEVCALTLQRLKEAGRHVALLPEWSDVDTVDDLRLLLHTSRNPAFRRTSSYALLQEMLLAVDAAKV